MKEKRSFVWVLLAGMLVLICGASILLVGSSSDYALIIGGADAPTFWFLLSSRCNGLPLVLVVLGLSLSLSAGFCLLFSKTVKTHCTLHTTAISLGLSATGALGLVCVYSWLVIVSFGKMAEHPVAYPASILLGLLCLVVFILLLYFYFVKRCHAWTTKGFVIDVLTVLVYLPTWFFTFGYLYEWIRVFIE